MPRCLRTNLYLAHMLCSSQNKGVFGARDYGNGA
jgi:hypothetical protein